MERDGVAEVFANPDNIAGAAGIGGETSALRGEKYVRHTRECSHSGRYCIRRSSVNEAHGMRTHTWMCRRVPPARLPRFGSTEVIITALCAAERESRMERAHTTLGSAPRLVRRGVGIILREEWLQAPPAPEPPDSTAG
jgi:hypothetical protein